MSKEDQQELVYKLCPTQYTKLLEEIKASRDLNTSEHDTIKKIAGESAELAEKVDNVMSAWTSFWGIIMMLRNIFFTLGFVYILATLVVNWGGVIKAVGN